MRNAEVDARVSPVEWWGFVAGVLADEGVTVR